MTDIHLHRYMAGGVENLMTVATGAVWSHYVLRHIIRLHTHVSMSTNGPIVRRLLAESNCARAQIRCGAVLRDEGEETM